MKCNVCDYEWNPRFEDRIPSQCPRCKSRYWKDGKRNWNTRRGRN